MSKSKKFLKKHYETLKLNIRRIKKNNFKQNCDILFEFNPWEYKIKMATWSSISSKVIQQFTKNQRD